MLFVFYLCFILSDFYGPPLPSPKSFFNFFLPFVKLVDWVTNSWLWFFTSQKFHMELSNFLCHINSSMFSEDLLCCSMFWVGIWPSVLQSVTAASVMFLIRMGGDYSLLTKTLRAWILRLVLVTLSSPSGGKSTWSKQLEGGRLCCSS